jgi:hypothetical protein
MPLSNTTTTKRSSTKSLQTIIAQAFNLGIVSTQVVAAPVLWDSVPSFAKTLLSLVPALAPPRSPTFATSCRTASPALSVIKVQVATKKVSAAHAVRWWNRNARNTSTAVSTPLALKEAVNALRSPRPSIPHKFAPSWRKTNVLPSAIFACGAELRQWLARAILAMELVAPALNTRRTSALLLNSPARVVFALFKTILVKELAKSSLQVVKQTMFSRFLFVLFWFSQKLFYYYYLLFIYIFNVFNPIL